MSVDKNLREEIIRYVKHTGKFATPHNVTEGLRNRWQHRLEGEGKPSYSEQMADILEELVGTGKLRGDETHYMVPGTEYPKPKGWISFAWTTPALLSGHKTVTRRDWQESYAARFHQGDVLQAYDRNPRYGGKPVALIRLTHTPFRENTAKIPDIDWYNEGFAYLQGLGKKVNRMTPREFWDDWREKNPREVWVLRFELLEVL